MPHERTLAELDAEIGELSAHLDAATCRLLAAVAEFDRREGWGTKGFRSCAHWLSWRTGLDLGAARERVRVGRALEALPLTGAAFAAGELSYSKVRAISRAASAETEEQLLEVARHGTAWHLEKLVRLFRRASSAEERERALRRRAERYLETWTDSDGMLVIRGRLPAEVGAVLKRALDAAMAELGETEEQPAAQREAPTTAPVSAETSEPPEDESGMDESEVEHRSEEEDDEPPPPGGVFVAWPSGSVAPLRPRVDGEQARRAADAIGLVARRALEKAASDGGGREGRFEVVLHVDSEVLCEDALVGRCELEGGVAVSAETARRLCCASPFVTLVHGVDGAPVGPGRRTRRISAPLWRALRSRDETCAFPGCTCRRGLAVHHVRHWAHGGETKLDNLLLLCPAHHFAVHEGGFRAEGRPPDEVLFFAPDGTPIPASGASTVANGDLVQINRAHGLSIGPDAGQTRWTGEAMDYDWAVMSLLHRSRAA
jgi:hypothetical protein